MRIIPILLIGIGLLAACTTEPDRPDDTPAPPPPPPTVCEEKCAKDADCGPAGSGMACCLDTTGTCGEPNRCLEVGATIKDPAGRPVTVCVKDTDCGDGACSGGICVTCKPVGDDPAAPNKYCMARDAKKPLCTFDPADPGGAACGECQGDVDCKGKPGLGRCAPVPFPATAAPFGTDAAEGVEYLCVCDEDSVCKAAGAASGVKGRDICRAEGCVCSSDAGCAANEACVLGVCVACGDDADCAAKPDDGDPATLAKTQCVGEGTVGASCGCASDAECEPDADGNATFCHKESGSCVACRTNADCGGTTPVCVAGGTADAACVCSANSCGAGSKCYGMPGMAGATCGCTSNAQCADKGGTCDTATGLCAVCLADADCTRLKLGSVCVEGSCTCAAGSECGAPKTAPALTWVCE